MSESNVTGDNIKGVVQARTIKSVILNYFQHEAQHSVPPLQLPEPVDHFTGREDELPKIMDELRPGKVVTLCGPGGIGKTALAAEAVWRLAESNTLSVRFPDGIIFYSFYGQSDIAITFDHIVRSYNEGAADTSDTAAFRVLSQKKALLMLDGAEEADNLRSVLKIRGTCGVIVTSRNKGDALTDWHDIIPLESGKAIELLHALAGDFAGDETVTRQICKLVGRLPLAVRLIGRYLARRKQMAGKYLAWLQDSPLKALNQGKRQEQSVPLLLERSLKQVSLEARQVLSVAGLLSLNHFHEEVIAKALDISSFEAGNCLGELVNYGLLIQPGEYEDRYEISHTLIYTYVRKNLAPNDKILTRVAEYYVTLTQEKDYARLSLARPHIMKVMEACKNRNNRETLINMVMSAVDYLDNRGYLTELLSALEMGLKAARKSEDIHSESSFLVTIGNCHFTVGRLNKAVQDYGKAIELMEGLRSSLETRGEWPPQMTNDLAGAYMNRGVALDKKNLFQDAINDYERAIGLMDKLVFRDNFSPAIPNLQQVFYMALLAFRKTDDTEGAREMAFRATTFLEKLPQLIDIHSLPELWQKQFIDLEQILTHFP